MSAWEGPAATDEWYTPPSVFKALGCWFDMDVCPARHARGHVPTTYNLVGDGLIEPWEGFVWGNFPFGGRNGLEPWLTKFMAHGNGIALVPDRTSAPWFWAAFTKADAVLFTRKIRFLRPDGSEGKSPSCGTALMARGEIGFASLQRAADAGFGIMTLPWTRRIAT